MQAIVWWQCECHQVFCNNCPDMFFRCKDQLVDRILK